MKRLKILIVSAALLMTSVVSGGCWNYNDVDTQFVVMGVVVDKEDDEFIMYAEVSKAKGGAEAELVTRVEKFRGKTLFDATRNGILKIGSKIYWGHTMVYIISESVASEGLADVLSLLSRQTQIRSDLFIMICDDASIDKIFTFEDKIHPDVSEHLHDLVNNYEAAAKVRKTPLFKVLQELASTEISLMLPVVKMLPAEYAQMDESASAGEDENPKDGKPDLSAAKGEEKPEENQPSPGGQQQPEDSPQPQDSQQQDKPEESQKPEEGKDKPEESQKPEEGKDKPEESQQSEDGQGGGEEEEGSSKSSGSADDDTSQDKDIVITDGSAIFAGDMMVGRLTDSETRSALILKQEISNNYVLAIDVSSSAPSCAIEIIESKLTIKPYVTTQNTLLFEIDLYMEADLVELLTQVDYITDDRKYILEEAFENMLERELMSMIRKAQDAGSDIVGFAGYTHRDLQSYWKNMPSVWTEVYKQSTFNVTVDVDITSSSLSMNPIKVGN